MKEKYRKTIQKMVGNHKRPEMSESLRIKKITYILYILSQAIQPYHTTVYYI